MKTVRKVIIAIALILSSVNMNARTLHFPGAIEPVLPTAYDITMTPLVQASSILPFNATAATGNIAAFTLQTIPASSQGILNIDMNGTLVPVSEGMMLTPDLAGSLVFIPEPSFTGTVVFTYTASDEEGLISNIASYTIPVIGQQPAILPIKLLNFTGTEQNKKVQLYWQTENEGNSSYFEVQRSTDGNTFETFATATAKGNITTTNSYQQTDDLLFYNYKTVYYRVKMVDINGSFKYSSSVMIKIGEIIKTSVKAWPLPFTSNLTIEYNSEKNEAIKITIRSVNGSEIMNLNSVVKKGSNTISLYQAQTIPAGTYVLTISNSIKAETIKVIKQ